MNEALPKPANENIHGDGELVELRIKYRPGKGDRFTETGEDSVDAEWESWDERSHGVKLLTYQPSPAIEASDVMYGVDSFEGLLSAKKYLQSFSEDLADWEASPGEITPDGKRVTEYLRRHIADIRDLIRYQSEALSEEADSEQISKRAEKITSEINTLTESFGVFAEALEDETGEQLRELASEIESFSRTGEPEKTGWWNKDFQKEQGYIRDFEGEPKQVWGEQDGPIGFEPSVSSQNDEDKERAGWWEGNFREQKGFPDVSPYEQLTQKGEVVSGEVLWPEFPELTPKPITLPDGHKVKFPDLTKEDTPTLLPVEDSGEVSTLGDDIKSTPKSESVALDTATYEAVLKEWVQAKRTHEQKQQEYTEAVQKYYADLEKDSFLAKNWTKLKASFGIKPELPEEIQSMRNEMFAATSAYNELAQSVLEARAAAGKEHRYDVSEKVLLRHSRMLTRSLFLNTFNQQKDSQAQAIENLRFKQGWVGEKFQKNKSLFRLLGAGAVGAATGGIIPAGVWWLRSTVGATASAYTAKVVSEKTRQSVAAAEAVAKEDYLHTVDEIEKTLKIGRSLSQEELENIYSELSEMYATVDTETQKRIIKILGATIAAGLIAGGAVGGAAEYFGEGFDSSPVETGEETVHSEATDKSKTVVPIEKRTLEELEAAMAVEADTRAASLEYSAEKGDNFWDLMEGQTNAGTFDYVDNVEKTHQQEVIDLVRDRINEDASLRASLGFGESADSLQIGAAIDIEKLNILAEEIAKEKGWYQTEVVPGAAQDVKADTAPVESSVVESLQSEKTITAPQESVPALVSVDRNAIQKFARNYEGDFTKFEEDFTKLLVEKVQGPPKNGGLLALLSGNKPKTVDAFKVFSPYTIGEFNELSKLDEALLAQEFSENSIDMRDYLAWRDVIAEWQKQGLKLSEADQFGDVARAAFIKSLEAPKA